MPARPPQPVPGCRSAGWSACRRPASGFRVLLVLALLCAGRMAVAQTPQDTAASDSIRHWSFGGFGSLSFSQTSFNNWAAGGENAISLSVLANLSALYETKTFRWQNIFDSDIGYVKQGEETFRKNQDRLDLFSKFGYKFSEKLLLTSQFNLRTQYAPGFNLPNDSVVTSRFFAPAYLNLAIGLDYHPTDWLSVLAAPAAGKFTFVLDQAIADSGLFGVEGATLSNGFRVSGSGNRVRSELGALVSIFIKHKWEDVNITSRADFFNNFTNAEPGQRSNIDVNWETVMTFKFNEWLAMNVSMTWIYDHDVDVPIFEEKNGTRTQVGSGPRLQLKQVLGVGLSYSFGIGQTKGSFKLAPENAS